MSRPAWWAAVLTLCALAFVREPAWLNVAAIVVLDALLLGTFAQRWADERRDLRQRAALPGVVPTWYPPPPCPLHEGCARGPYPLACTCEPSAGPDGGS